MKKLLVIAMVAGIGCTGNDQQPAIEKDHKIALRTDTLNVVNLKDTLVIYEGTCRGCAYENSTSFDISDSMGIIKLQDIITTDNNSPGMNGGSIGKDIILVPQKTGRTNIKLFKFLRQDEKDSTKFRWYPLEVKN